MDTTYISVGIKSYTTKNINIRKEYKEKPSIVPNLIISPKIHSFVLWEHVKTKSRWVWAVKSLRFIPSTNTREHLHGACPRDSSLSRTSSVAALALLELRVQWPVWGVEPWDTSIFLPHGADGFWEDAVHKEDLTGEGIFKHSLLRGLESASQTNTCVRQDFLRPPACLQSN